MGLISASSGCASFPDLLLVSCSFNVVPLLFSNQPYPLLSAFVFHSPSCYTLVYALLGSGTR
ncbi:hypothetical protein Tco_0634324, partial [Tanacetum coccineum]